MKSIILIFALALTLSNCDERRTNRINHDATIETEVKKDSSQIEIADLPILIDSTDYLIHPIGHITEYKSRFSSYSGKRGYNSFSVSNYNDFSIQGEFSNLKFQHINSEKLTALTDKIVEITSVRFLETIREQTGFQYLIYTIRDTDTNKDSKINSEDIEALYISTIDGKNLKKLTPDLAKIAYWKVIPKLNRLYFKSISDTNKNGEFDKHDHVNYQYINLKSNNLNVIDYKPL
ncbi:hypothetical protein HNV08_11745 [Winogradskyella eckloniae]|uniref:hypothetical protein n=1 Tax=Winogradskyella eckloniae TaxID=1089306 RepID=UPI001564CA2D|nr:hypothetical protein [Winogradskyella eckloniae]NRD20723.1 hypothetical protein [Winogradskyella eckloniae]